MPKYDYHCNNCNKIHERNLPIVRRHEPLVEMCPHCGTTGFVSMRICGPNMVRDTPRLDDGFREVLSRIHERTAGSTLKDNIR